MPASVSMPLLSGADVAPGEQSERGVSSASSRMSASAATVVKARSAAWAAAASSRQRRLGGGSPASGDSIAPGERRRPAGTGAVRPQQRERRQRVALGGPASAPSDVARQQGRRLRVRQRRQDRSTEAGSSSASAASKKSCHPASGRTPSRSEEVRELRIARRGQPFGQRACVRAHAGVPQGRDAARPLRTKLMTSSAMIITNATGRPQ